MAKKLLAKNSQPEMDLKGQRFTEIGKHHRIRNISSYPLVFVAKFYHNQERDNAGGGGIIPFVCLLGF